jgi:pimeloyl-ACP methyl ester carboxylesterase
LILGVAVSGQPVRTQVFLPPPTGPFAIGTTTWHLVDTSREEVFAHASARQEAGNFREVEVHVWYPAAAGKHVALAPYLRDGLDEVRTFAKVLRRPDEAFDELAGVLTHAEVDRPIAVGRFPLIVFSAGYTGVASAHTALLEDLASHGYVVANVVHPYEVAAATLLKGRVVTMLDESGVLRPEIQAVFAEWGQEDAAMTAVTQATTLESQRTALRAYLSGLTKTNVMERRWVDDMRKLVASVRAPEKKMAAISSHVDLNRVVAAGHSMGGVAAAQFCAEEKACLGALNLDGIPQYGAMIDARINKPLLMVYSARPGRAGANDAIYGPASSVYYRVDVDNTRHLDFADMTLWGGPLRELPVLGSISPVRATSITRTIAFQFFEEVLSGRPSPVLNSTAPTPIPGATIRKMGGGVLPAAASLPGASGPGASR